MVETAVTLSCVILFRSYNLHLDANGTEVPHCSTRLLSNLVVSAQSQIRDYHTYESVSQNIPNPSPTSQQRQQQEERLNKRVSRTILTSAGLGSVFPNSLQAVPVSETTSPEQVWLRLEKQDHRNMHSQNPR